jgi:hypothetical protein
MHQNNYNLSLSSQNFVVDFLRFNLQFINKYEIQEVAEYLSKEYSCNIKKSVPKVDVVY